MAGLGLMQKRRLRRLRASARPVVRRTVRASASKAPLDDKKALGAQWMRRQEWQDEGWAYFDEVPEIKYSVWYLGNVMAKARWFVGVRDPKDPEADPVPITDGTGISPALIARAQAELARLHGPLGGLSEIARELNMNLEVAGMAYLVGLGERTEDKNGKPLDQPVAEQWDIRSVSEVDKQGDGIKIKSSPDDQNPMVLDEELDTCITIWQRHPRWSMQADCNMRGVLSECEALVLLSNQVKAEAKSRMGAGIVTLPNELGQGEIPDDDGDGSEDPGLDPLMQSLYEMATDPIEDPSSAAAVAPAFVRGPAEFLQEKYLRHLTFGRETSQVLEERIAARVERIARGLNLPVEVVMGHQQTTFTNAVQIEADIYEKHFQPRLVLVADALTVGFLHPNLLDPVEEGGKPEFKDDDVKNVCVWFDPVDMVKQADPVEHATEGVNLGLIGGETWRRLLGFSEDDAPDPEEILVRSVMHLRSFDPGISTAILELLGVDLNVPESLPGTSSPAAAAEPMAASASTPELIAMLTAAAAAKRAGQPIDIEGLLRSAFPMIAAGPVVELRALPAATAARRDIGYRLMLIDRELRGRIQSSASAALTRILERAGNRLRSKLASSVKIDLRTVDSLHVAATVGRPLVAAAGFGEDDLIGGDEEWALLEQQFLEWGAQAQTQAIALVKQVVGLTDAATAELEARQFANLGEAWEWMRSALHDLAVGRLYGPDPLAPAVGEFDPTSTVPTGLVRQALARAGGARDVLTTEQANPYVVVGPGDIPLGGLATGADMMDVLGDAGALVEAYEWVYGPAYRKSAFEEHEALDGEVFTDFTSDLLVAGDWIGDYYFPGDHDGCCCDIAPTIVAPEDLDEGNS